MTIPLSLTHIPLGSGFGGPFIRSLEKIRLTLSRTSIVTPQNRLVWLAVASILRSTSSVGTAQWQYLLPNKTKVRISEPFAALEVAGSIMRKDIQESYANLERQHIVASQAIFLQSDVRDLSQFPKNVADLVITSPPYANNYDYADATRLEMTFFKEIAKWGDLQKSVRANLVRACTQHVSKDEARTFDIISSSILKPISRELEAVCKELDCKRHNYGGKKQYHTMLAYYFFDMVQALKTIRHVSVPGAKVCMVIGDSAPYGVYAPVEKWLGELALSVGFKHYRFEKVRDRNVKWKNRKHTVPLKEGYLWIEG